MTGRELPASIEQRLLWYLDRYRGQAGALNCPVIFDVEGGLDRPALAAALGGLLRRHETLRTTFAGRGRKLTQVIGPPHPLEVNEVDIGAPGDPADAVRQAIASEVRTPIDPTRAPLRVTVWRSAGDRHTVCVNMHHLAADGWSCGLVFRDLRLLYERALGAAAEPPPLRWPYSRYVEWQRATVEGPDYDRHCEYWQQQLEGARLPPLPIGPIGDSGETTTHAAEIEPAACVALRQLARARRTTTFNVMLSTYYALVHGLTGESDLAVPSLFANRVRPELADTVGAFANMVILRTRLTPRATFGDLLREAHATAVGAFMYQALPFQMVPGLAIRGRAFRADDIVFHVATRPLPDAALGTARARPRHVEAVGNRFALELAVLPRGDGLTAVLSYNQGRVDAAWARLFLARYAELAARVAAAPDVRLDALRD